MAEYRIVVNEQTDKFRIERRGWWTWGFVMNDSKDDYATFDSYEAARDYVCKHLLRQQSGWRRWRVLGPCDA